MASKKPVSTAPHPANLSLIQMQEALPRLKRRLIEIEEFIFKGTVDEISASTSNFEKKYEDTLIDIFGNNSLEVERYRTNFYDYTSPIIFDLNGYNPSYEEEVEPYKKGILTAIRNLRTIIEIFNEKIGDSTGPSVSPSRALDNLHLHPQIADASVDLFKDGHYANAVEDACKVLDLLVRMKSKKELSGTELMQVAFSPKAPILKFNDQQNDSEKKRTAGHDVSIFWSYASVPKSPSAWPSN
jgi:hypothetical protein